MYKLHVITTAIHHIMHKMGVQPSVVTHVYFYV
jgi:hypothetical protein